MANIWISAEYSNKYLSSSTFLRIPAYALHFGTEHDVFYPIYTLRITVQEDDGYAMFRVIIFIRCTPGETTTDFSVA